MEEQADENAARLDASISRVPKHADFVGRRGVTSPRLADDQLAQLSALLHSEARWNRAGGATRTERVWTAKSVAELLGRSFGRQLLDLVEAELSPLGRRLTGVDPWPGAASTDTAARATAARM